MKNKTEARENSWWIQDPEYMRDRMIMWFKADTDDHQLNMLYRKYLMPLVKVVTQDHADAREAELLKEIDDLKLQLVDRSDKYKIAMDKGVYQLGYKNKQLLGIVRILDTSLRLAKGELSNYREDNLRTCGVYERVRDDIATANEKLKAMGIDG